MSADFRSTFPTRHDLNAGREPNAPRHHGCFHSGSSATLGALARYPFTSELAPMALRPLSRFGARLLSIFLLAGCARDTASPVEPTALFRPTKPNSAAPRGLLPVRGVTRARRSPKDITVSAVIGKKGGTITIPDAGLTLVVPAGRGHGEHQVHGDCARRQARRLRVRAARHQVRRAAAVHAGPEEALAPQRADLAADGRRVLHRRSKLNQKLGLAFVTELLPGDRRPAEVPRQLPDQPLLRIPRFLALGPTL